MNTRTAIIYSSVDGQTRRICDKIQEVFLKNNQAAELFSIDDFKGKVEDYDRLIIGSSIRYGVHNEKIIDFIERNKAKLDAIRTAFFSVNLVARKPEKNSPETNPYMLKYLKTTDWRPKKLEVFAGKLDYKKYKFFDRIMIQFIMWMTKGPTDPNVEIEYTDWDQVNAFAQEVSKM
ncbi:MAG: menaquinone-dependent protoporphyrinogen IX dehydrogenase [Flavobacteriaceae bacterium]|nr:menaquinone-dependent protoporphyrinogen IX dehydrogenase [Flavobacteriaceae bacterium]